MNKARLEGIRVCGMHVAVPPTTRGLDQEGLFETPAEMERLIKSIGVARRRIADKDICTSDLCQAAARRLLDQLGWGPGDVDVLIFVTQSADYVIPATACALQARLGLDGCMAFDVNLGCSGYAYGLWTAASLLKTVLRDDRPARALLLAGDVSTSKLLPGDRGTVPLFGDAGSATALEVSPGAPPMYGVFGTDGTGAEHLIIRAGALREPLLPPESPHDPETQARLYRNARLHLNGPEVFNFTLRCVPELMREILALSGDTVADVDYFLFHQANSFMLTHLRKKAGLPEEKVPIALQEFGNTSSASIPLTVAAMLADRFAEPRQVVLAGFGVGWSWGAVRMQLGAIPRPEIIVYEPVND